MKGYRIDPGKDRKHQVKFSAGPIREARHLEHKNTVKTHGGQRQRDIEKLRYGEKMRSIVHWLTALATKCSSAKVQARGGLPP
jgi:hypothetical protein